MSFLRPIGTGNHESLAADTNVEFEIPGRARIARLVVDVAVRYTIGDTAASGTVGFALASGTHDIDVAGGQTLNIYETGGSGDAYVEFFGADINPTPVRIKNDHQQILLSTNSVETLPFDSIASVMLAADTVATETVPDNVKTAHIRVGNAVRYTTDGSEPSAMEGPELAASTSLYLDVSAVNEIKFFETGGATSARIVYTPRLRTRATHLLVRSNQAFLFSTDGVDPTADRGIYIAANTTVKIPCFEGEVKVRRAGNSSTTIEFQEFEDLHTGGDIYEQNVFRPVGGFYVALTSDVEQVDVPKNAQWAWLSAQDAGIKYTTGGVTPTAAQRGFSVASNGNVKVPVSDGTERLQLLRSAANAKATVMFFGR